MKRLLVALIVALPATAGAAPQVFDMPADTAGASSSLALAVAHFSAAFDLHLVPPAFVDAVVRWQYEARDAWHRVEDRFAALADSASIALPDLTVLALDPMGDSALEKSSGFGWRDDPIRHSRRYHSGTDLRAHPGTPVLAAGDGVVVFAGRQGGYGNVIYVDHGGGVVTLYAHLRRIETKKDAAIIAGQHIGQVGSTGRATGPHLHFEVRLDGHPVDPVAAMSIAALWRESPAEGRLAAFALAPELQANAQSDIDPPRGKRPAAKPDAKARPGRAKRQQVLW